MEKTASLKGKKPKNLVAWLFLLPYLYFFVSYMLYPIIKGFVTSFYEVLPGMNRFVGLQNYVEMLKDSKFWESLWHTIYFVIISTPSLVLLGFLFAMLVNLKLKGSTILRAGFFLPYILAVSVIANIWVFIFQPYTGFINGMIHQLGIVKEIFWLSDANLAFFSILIATIWWTVGFNMILLLAGLQDIPDDYYEAARIDGANWWTCLKYITLPCLKSTIILVIMLQSIASFKMFGQAWLMTSGGPGSATRTLVQYIYETGFRQNRLGYAAAMSYGLFIITLLFSLLQFKFLSGRNTK